MIDRFGEMDLNEETCEESRDVGCVRSYEDNTERAPDVDEDLVGPGLGSWGHGQNKSFKCAFI